MKKATETWNELEDGGRIIVAGNSIKYKTGDWRTNRPIWDKSKCTQCMICWLTCPDSSIAAKNKERVETDFDHCKGCGICAEVCPVKCIKMKPETDFQ
ncbi:MAG: 4Fe-4S binding protein [Nanoarchaeota archaeon]